MTGRRPRQATPTYSVRARAAYSARKTTKRTTISILKIAFNGARICFRSVKQKRGGLYSTLANHHDPPGCQPLGVVLVDGLDFMVTTAADKTSSLGALLESVVHSPIKQNDYGNENDLVLFLFSFTEMCLEID